ncbi:MAG: DNA mismatch repair endonuclease MutL [Treponema sp.]|uniref:DNA mismatch repair endonuclease MutL n=1 Tax=Treponema sp. TaxID=166 RepID=UPI0025EF3E3B|nr:DNA mismatch repair endonuclease MutL [Treponema sp.]MBQ8680122.1 DNA mismatch repair endonuclease MutL [Treponema sp.]
MSERRPVKQLSVDVARKIAAGEVIDRPSAIVRELLDNAVDSGATSINVEIEGGGIEKIRISDNGAGMTGDDLKNCARPHCTSKISESEDLLNLTTLGFRGEALASIAAVARLTISSGTKRMKASITEDHLIETIPPVQDGKGTIVMSEGLFENFPARRNFLKRPSSESMMCREVFTEKTLPRPNISFRLTVDGTIRADLPSGVTLAERFARALELKESTSLFAEIKSSGTESDGVSKWSFSLVIGEPSVYRNDRKHIYIFVNGRRVQEFSLMQAIEYGCQGFFPNGTHPVAALFLQVEPKLVDFNIHPAKKEVRFKDISSVHHGVSSAVKNYFKSYGIKSAFEREQDFQEEIARNEKNTLFQAIIDNEQKREDSRVAGASLPASHFSSERNTDVKFNIDHTRSYSSRLAEFALEKETRLDAAGRGYDASRGAETKNIRFQTSASAAQMRFSVPGSPALAKKDEDFIYYGTIFGTFLMAQKGGVFYLIDQHAVHERILFNQLMSGGSEKQELLIPYEIKTNSKEEDDYLSSIQTTLSTAGFTCENKGNGKWIFTSIPARWSGSQKDLQEAIFEKQVSPQEIIYQIAAMTACKAAVKDGTILGPEAAEQLARDALNLKDPHCPHGRPVWTTLTKEELFARVRRTR